MKLNLQPLLEESVETEVYTDELLEEVVFGTNNDFDLDDTSLDNGRCGICLDIVIDRGVLDCCDHWFCFACVDNWATITNLCPLCKSEFQLITCIPVYDTIGGTKVEEDVLMRDDDWCIEGKNNTLSFPSYYIDEDAVICLGDDGCKIRNGLATTAEDVTLDTSIACDSCDLWYHAFCVGFDPEITSQSSWLCPRCKTDEGPPLKSDGVVIPISVDQSNHANTNSKYSTEDIFSGKLLVSVADAGETAVVVSMVEVGQWTEAGEDFQIDMSNERKKEKPWEVSNFNSETTEARMQPSGSIGSLSCNDVTAKSCGVESFEKSKTAFSQLMVKQEIDENEALLTLSSLQDASLFEDCGMKIGDIYKPTGSDEEKVSTPLLIDKFNARDESDRESDVNLHHGLGTGASLSVDELGCGGAQNKLAEGVHQKDLSNSSVQSSLSVFSDEKTGISSSHNVLSVAHKESHKVNGVKRKRIEKSSETLRLHKEKVRDAEPEVANKKLRSDAMSLPFPVTSQPNQLRSDGSEGGSVLRAKSREDSRQISRKKAPESDIKSIVQEASHRSSKVPADSNPADKSKEGDKVSGLRIKKIMRRQVDDEASTLLQKLRKEIREAVRDKASKDFSKNDGLFDPKLLAAFRAAVAGPEIEPVKKVNPSVIRAKKMILQKGKTRESLTKKLYGTSSGRRRRAWDRDWEVEFWKHRCVRTQPDKVETLKSVLALLKRDTVSCTENSRMEQGPEGLPTNSILSRLYLADASVFPRKDDIKPLSALNEKKSTELDSSNAPGKSDELGCKNHVNETSKLGKRSVKHSVPFGGDTAKSGSSLSLKGEATGRKVHTDGKARELNYVSPSNVSSANVQRKECLTKPNDSKIDKRKWALEVLARKTSSSMNNATKEKQEDQAMKGKYPLLAQLPYDMRPSLASSRHGKIPSSIRQAQLYRLAERYLSVLDLPAMRRTADTELAIADAVNMEKEICDKSTSRVVYSNLCAQVISQISNNLNSKMMETTPSCPLGLGEGSEHIMQEAASNPDSVTCENVEEALKMAGLLSDSSPNSPCGQAHKPSGEDFTLENAMDEGPVNVLDVDSHPELDIYGDFEYDLEHDEYIGPSCVLNSSKLQGDGELKMKVLLSTVNCERACDALASLGDAERHLNSGMKIPAHDHEKPGTEKVNSSSPPECQENGPPEKILTSEVMTADPCNLCDSKRDEQLSLECDELYGPYKEPPVNKVELLAREPIKRMQYEAVAENTTIAGKENIGSNKATTMSNFATESCAENNFVKGSIRADNDSSGGENSPNHSLTSKSVPTKLVKSQSNKHSDIVHSITRKVEAYVKEHIRPLCKSGVINIEQYRWAVVKTTEKVMRYHSRDKNANFLIREGDKVKKLAEQYVESAQRRNQ